MVTSWSLNKRYYKLWSVLEIRHFNQKNELPGSFSLLITSLGINVSHKYHPLKTLSTVSCVLPRRPNDDIHLVGLSDLKRSHSEVGCIINYFKIFVTEEKLLQFEYYTWSEDIEVSFIAHLICSPTIPSF